MNFGTVVLTIAAACGTAQEPSDARRHQVVLPPRIESEQTHLLLRDVVLPQSEPVLLRVYAVVSDSSTIYLGSTAVPAVTSDSAAVTTIGVLRINVTDGIRTWRSSAMQARTVDIEIKAFGTGGISVPNLRWSFRELQLVHPN